MTIDDILRLAYGANILILVPVVGVLLAAGSPALVFGAGVAESQALRLLVASLWGAILVCSVLALYAPRVFVGVLILQVIYKSTWLLIYVLPTWRRGLAVPWGPALTFIPIVLIWPVIIGLEYQTVIG